MCEVKKISVLLVEDNIGDVFLTRQCMEKANSLVDLYHVENGKKCLEYLRKEGEFKEAPRPKLIIMDLNMPVMGGKEAFAKIVEDPNLRQIPVVILTTSTLKADVEAMYNLRCSSYFKKPLEFSDLERIIQAINESWLDLAEDPG